LGGFLDSVCTIYGTLNIRFDTITLCSVPIERKGRYPLQSMSTADSAKAALLQKHTRPSKIVIRNSGYTRTASSPNRTIIFNRIYPTTPPPPPFANTITRIDSNTSVQSPIPKVLHSTPTTTKDRSFRARYHTPPKKIRKQTTISHLQSCNAYKPPPPPPPPPPSKTPTPSLGPSLPLTRPQPHLPSRH